MACSVWGGTSRGRDKGLKWVKGCRCGPLTAADKDAGGTGGLGQLTEGWEGAQGSEGEGGAVKGAGCSLQGGQGCSGGTSSQ